MSTVTIEAGKFGWDHLITHKDGRTILVQTDMDYPSLASNLGWSPAVVAHTADCGCGDPRSEHCQHDGTDGTIDCACGIKTGTFLLSAKLWLDDHLSEPFEDPGYFGKPQPIDPWRIPLRSDDVAVKRPRRDK